MGREESSSRYTERVYVCGLTLTTKARLWLPLFQQSSFLFFVHFHFQILHKPGTFYDSKNFL
ncbi:hypothetical protein WN51_04987 [Melipona quadrifasciata]|uniref:Uncharacterized protein n=1 Tax=Melipona quadrifasciata TaxID=166423 RepID=A0A0M8ZRM5_9HYME|nr:hypothetical protein WN51_04987 [Melipona quadrifasciata]